MEDKKRLRLGVVSGALFVIILAVLIAVNILVEKLDISWDLSREGIYTISDQTTSILEGLNQDITIYIISSEEDFPIGYKQIINQYTKTSNHIKVVYRDLELYPNFASQYMDSSTATVTENSIIVVCGEKHVYLDADEYVSTTISSDYLSYTSSLDFEPILTSAINSVNDGETYKLYCTTGHNELTLLSSTQTGLIRDNYEYEDWNIITEDVPEDADVILINAPTSDFSTEDCDKLRDYMEQGGKVYYIIEATVELENLTDFVADYGIQIEEGVVMEQDTSMIYGETPTYMIPEILNTEVTEDLYNAGMPLLILVSKGLTEIEGSDCTLTGLVTTSNYAYSKVNLDSAYLSREDEDIEGPFYLAMVSEQESGGGLLVLGSSNVLNDSVDELVSGNNTDFFLNGVNYLLGDTDKISIRGKEIQNDYNLYTTSQVYTIGFSAVIGIPVILIVIGIVIVVLRKTRSQNYGRKKDNGQKEIDVTETEPEEKAEPEEEEPKEAEPEKEVPEEKEPKEAAPEEAEPEEEALKEAAPEEETNESPEH